MVSRVMFFGCLLGIALMTGACSGNTSPTATPAPEFTLVPSVTAFVRPTLPPPFTATPTPDVSPTPTAVLIEPLTGVKVEPPMDITLPDGWQFGYDTMIFEEVGDLTYVPIALYQGPVTDGTGTIVLIWNFRSITAGNPLTGTDGTPNMWVDGLRLLRSLVFDPSCNIGTDPQRDFTVGGLPAVGTNFRAVTCPETPDTRGWFAGLTVDDVNFVFYMYTDPIDAMQNDVPYQLQAILDSIVFRVSDLKQ